MNLPTIGSIITSSTSDINSGISFFTPVIIWAFSIGVILFVVHIALNFFKSRNRE